MKDTFILTDYERGLSRAADIADGHAKMNRDAGHSAAAIPASSVAAFIEQAMWESFRARGADEEQAKAFFDRRHVRFFGGAA